VERHEGQAIPEQFVKLVTSPDRVMRRAPKVPSGPTMDYSYSQESSETFASSGGGLAPGTKVRHPTFGVGIVRRSEGRGDQEKLMVQFARAGMKKLIRKFANLEVVTEGFDEDGASAARPARYYSR
jgi:hypothetical protein